ncbi:hypothetical protein LQZ19_00295 [Treponema primitia]|uniref:hypothetical protein n=1 Tax=Treponema primitia TaxID=88058 RepID=UPI003980B486
MKITKVSTIVIFVVVLLGLAVFCLTATNFKIIAFDELPLNFMGTFLGAIVTALITVILLNGQSAAEEEKERNVKVFEQKSKVFQEYINTVWTIWEDHKITADEFQNLTTGYYRDLMIYLDDKKEFDVKNEFDVKKIIDKEEKKNKKKPSKIIADCITAIGGCLDKSGEETYKILRKNVILIINVLSDQIGLGGKIDDKIIEEHDEQMFPVLFRKALLKSLNDALVEGSDMFRKGVYQEVRGGSGTFEYAVFEFLKFPDCKIIVGPFTIAKDYQRIELDLIVGWQYWQVHDFRVSKSNDWRIFVDKNKLNANCTLEKPLPGARDEMELQNFSGIHFDDIESLKKNYQSNYREAADEIARRAIYHFNNHKIEDKSIPEFLQTYIIGNTK